MYKYLSDLKRYIIAFVCDATSLRLFVTNVIVIVLKTEKAMKIVGK